MSVRKTLFLPLIFKNLTHRTLSSYLMVRAGRFPCGSLDGTGLGALKNFVSQHPDLSGRCEITEDEMGVLLQAVEGVQSR